MPLGQIIFFHKTDISPVGNITIIPIYKSALYFSTGPQSGSPECLRLHGHAVTTTISSIRTPPGNKCNTRFNCLDHVGGFQNGIVRGRGADFHGWKKKTYTVTKSVTKTVTAASASVIISRNLIHTRSLAQPLLLQTASCAFNTTFVNFFLFIACFQGQRYVPISGTVSLVFAAKITG